MSKKCPSDIFYLAFVLQKSMTAKPKRKFSIIAYLLKHFTDFMINYQQTKDNNLDKLKSPYKSNVNAKVIIVSFAKNFQPRDRKPSGSALQLK